MVAEFLHRHLVTPLAKRAFREFLDIALVHQRDGLAASLNRTLNRVADQSFGAENRNRLDAYAGVETDLLLAAFQQVLIDEFD